MATPKQPRRKAQAASSSKPSRVVPDRQALEAFLSTTDPEVRAAADYEAQDLIYDAWERQTSRSRVALAYQALAISPLCADGYSLLASEAISAAEALDLYERGLEAATLALGPEGFAECDGRFWGYLQTRPYMRARHGLAMILVDMRRDNEAIAHFSAMLKLNPNDNQGIRYLLLAILLRQDDSDGVKALLASYTDDWSAQWLYTRALIAYREGHADKAETLELLDEAKSSNKHVPAILAGTKRARGSALDYIAVGSPDEARDYVREFGAAWRSTAGAVEWLVGSGPKPPARAAKRR